MKAIFYVLKTGCQWQQPPGFRRSTVYDYFAAGHSTRRGRASIIPAFAAATTGRLAPTPTASCLDSQSVKSTAVPGVRGYDAGQNVNGRKHHSLVDTLGLLLAVVVTRRQRAGSRRCSTDAEPLAGRLQNT